ncbi:MAG TPA: D-aminoacyl-tRNA deacylase [Fimbriimonadaceae bacterium]|nr:D-aminoacyl-tRNA deacylase [Fimbriimonadaceae bacterium]
MKAVVQRAFAASVEVEGEVIGEMAKGLVVFLGAHQDDTDADAAKMADRVVGLRIFSDEEGKMNLSLRDLWARDEQAGVLAISNFTLYGDASKNRRPSFITAAPYDEGNRLFERFVEELRRLDCPVETGVFGADMKVRLVNDGPVTLILEVMGGVLR